MKVRPKLFSPKFVSVWSEQLRPDRNRNNDEPTDAEKNFGGFRRKKGKNNLPKHFYNLTGGLGTV